MKSCRDCKHVRPDKDFTFFGGLLGWPESSWEFARCGKAMLDGSLSHCKILRSKLWDNDFIPCDRAGRGWEAK